MISKEKKAAIMKEYARTEGDTGSPEVQVAVLTARIPWNNFYTYVHSPFFILGLLYYFAKLPA